MPSFRVASWPRDPTWFSYIYLHWQSGSLPLVPPAKPCMCMWHIFVCVCVYIYIHIHTHTHIVLSRCHVQLFATPWTAAHKVPLSSGILQPRILKWVAMHSSSGSSQLRDQTEASHITGEFFTNWSTREAQEFWSGWPIPFPVDLSNPGIVPGSQADSVLVSYQGSSI